MSYAPPPIHLIVYNGSLVSRILSPNYKGPIATLEFCFIKKSQNRNKYAVISIIFINEEYFLNDGKSSVITRVDNCTDLASGLFFIESRVSYFSVSGHFLFVYFNHFFSTISFSILRSPPP